MAKVTRISYVNRIHGAGVVLAATSELSSMPRGALLDQLRSDVWRSAIGWDVSFRNNKINFNRGGVKVATIATGTYATGAALAAAIVTALEAADATPVWACTYDAGTKKFTISSDLAFILLFGTGASLVTSIAVDIGFAVADTASAVTHTGGTAVYQSRKAIIVDLGSAQSFAAGIVINHNMGTSGTVKLQASASDFASSWGFAGAPEVSQTLNGDASIRIAFFASQSYRYLRLLIDDTTNIAGYSEVGILFAGPYSQPSVGESIQFVKRYEQLSEVQTAIGGAHFQTQRGRRRVYGMSWLEIQQADIDIFEALDLAMPMGKNFFISFDAVDAPTNTVYGFLRQGIEEALTSGLYHNVPVEFAEALG